MNEKEFLQLVKRQFSAKLKDGLMNTQINCLIQYAEKLEKELDGHIDDVAQLEGMLRQANEKIEKLQKQLDAKIMFVSNGMEEEHWALQEENIRLNKEIERLKRPVVIKKATYMDLDD